MSRIYNNSDSEDYQSSDSDSNYTDEDQPNVNSVNYSIIKQDKIYKNIIYSIFIDTKDRAFNPLYNNLFFKCKLSTSGNSWNKYPIYENTKELPQNNYQKKLGIPGSPNTNGFIYNLTKFPAYKNNKNKGNILTYNNIYSFSEESLSIQNNIKNINCIKVKYIFLPKLLFDTNKINADLIYLEIKELHNNYYTTSPYNKIYSILKLSNHSSKFIEFEDISEGKAFYKGNYSSINTLTFDIKINNTKLQNNIEDFIEIKMIIPNTKNNTFLFLLKQKYNNNYFPKETNINFKNIKSIGNVFPSYPFEDDYNPIVRFEDYYTKKIFNSNSIIKQYIDDKMSEDNVFTYLNGRKIILKENIIKILTNIKICQLYSCYYPKLNLNIINNLYFSIFPDSITNIKNWFSNENNNQENKIILRLIEILFNKEFIGNKINTNIYFNESIQNYFCKIFGFKINKNILNRQTQFNINNNITENSLNINNISSNILENKIATPYYPSYVIMFSNKEGHSVVMEMILKFRRNANTPYSKKPISKSGYFKIDDKNNNNLIFKYIVRGSSQCPKDNMGNCYLKNNNDLFDLYGIPSKLEKNLDPIFMFRNKDDNNIIYTRKGLLSYHNENISFKNSSNINYNNNNGYHLHILKHQDSIFFKLDKIKINFSNVIDPEKEGFIQEPVKTNNNKEVFDTTNNSEVFLSFPPNNKPKYSIEENKISVTKTQSQKEYDLDSSKGPRVVQEWCIGETEDVPDINKNLEITDEAANNYFISLEGIEMDYEIDLSKNDVDNDLWHYIIISYLVNKYNIQYSVLFKNNNQTIELICLLLYSDKIAIDYFYKSFKKIKNNPIIENETLSDQQGKKNMILSVKNYMEENIENVLFKKKIKNILSNFSNYSINKWIQTYPQGSLILYKNSENYSFEEIYSLSSYKVNYDYFDNKIWISGSDSILFWKNFNKNENIGMMFVKQFNLSYISSNNQLIQKWDILNKKDNLFFAPNPSFNVFKSHDIIEIGIESREKENFRNLIKEKTLNIIDNNSSDEHSVTFFPDIKKNNKELNPFYKMKTKILIKGKTNKSEIGEFPNYFMPQNEKNTIQNISNTEDIEEITRLSLINSKKHQNLNENSESNIIVIKNTENFKINNGKIINKIIKNNFLSGSIETGKEVLKPLLINCDMQTKILIEIESYNKNNNINTNKNI